MINIRCPLETCHSQTIPRKTSVGRLARYDGRTGTAAFAASETFAGIPGGSLSGRNQELRNRAEGRRSYSIRMFAYGRKYALPAQQKTRAQGSAHGKFRVSAIRENKCIRRECETRKYQSEN
jgi:hypothetical protein